MACRKQVLVPKCQRAQQQQHTFTYTIGNRMEPKCEPIWTQVRRNYIDSKINDHFHEEHDSKIPKTQRQPVEIWEKKLTLRDAQLRSGGTTKKRRTLHRRGSPHEKAYKVARVYGQKRKFPETDIYIYIYMRGCVRQCGDIGIMYIYLTNFSRVTKYVAEYYMKGWQEPSTDGDTNSSTPPSSSRSSYRAQLTLSPLSLFLSLFSSWITLKSARGDESLCM